MNSFAFIGLISELNTAVLSENTGGFVLQGFNDDLFKEKHRLSDTAFQRNRVLNFSTLFLYLINLRKHSNQVELDQFFKVIKDKKEASQHITKSAFFQARKQMSYKAFIDINHQIIDGLYQSPKDYKTWKGFRLCAIDGSFIRLPNEPDIIEHFGVQKGRPGQSDCPMARASIFYDVMNNMVIDSAIKSRSASEHQCAEDHLSYSRKNDLVLYDRGYNAFWLYALHRQHKTAFCMRAKTNKNLIVKRFIDSSKKEDVVTFIANNPSKKTCKEKGLVTTPIKLRLIRVELKNEVEVLITNLIDSDKYDVGVFKSLYHLRWGIEENYKRLKQWVEIENFSGKSALSVQQDFYAKIVAANLTSLMANASQKKVKKNTAELKLKYNINFAQALSKMKHRIVQLILNHKLDVGSLIDRTIEYISRTIESVRPGSTAPRKLKNIKNDIHFPAYKSAL